MKKYTLKIFLNDSSVTETVTAETHTIENGVYIFWVRNDKGEWAQVCTYPISCVAIARIQNIGGKATVMNDSNITGNITVDIDTVNNNGFIEVEAPVSTATAKVKSKK